MKVFALGALFLLAAASASAGAPPPITDAEKAACEAVAAFLSRGPAAIRERLSTESPFFSAAPQEQLDEIEVRLGPRDAAVWELRTTTEPFAEHGAVFHVLFPSGVDDVVALDMASSPTGWKIKDIRTLANPLPAPPSPEQHPRTAELARPAGGNMLLLFIIAPLLAIVGAIFRTRMPRSSSAILALALIAFAISLARAIDPQWVTHLPARGQPAPRAPSYVPMKTLLPLRRALAAGTLLPPIGVLEGDLRDVALLWKTAAEIGAVPPEESKRQLASVQRLSATAMACLLRGSVAIDEGRSADAAKEYAALHQIDPQSDTFWLEEELAAPAASAGVNIIARTEKLRTRDAAVFYLRSAKCAFDGNPDGARHEFVEAWRIQPISRAEVIAAGAFALLIRDRAVSILVNLDSPNEEATADPSLARSPMVVPAETRSTATGTFVRLSIGDGRLDLPGGAAIAPATTQALGAERFANNEAEEALRRASRLSSHGLTSAAAQRTVEEAVEALSAHNRWSEIVKMTDAIGPASNGVATSLVVWRVRALLRCGNVAEARALATGPAATRGMQRSPDASLLLEISELMAQASAWEVSIDLLKKVSLIKDAPDVAGRLRQLDLRRELANSAVITSTPHFAIHATNDVPVTVTQRIGDLLEAELVRLSKALQVATFHPIRVNVVHWDNFKDQLTGSDHIVGFYDGEITIPFGGVARFRENVVSILSHELTHAMVAQASNDNAPRWFQEGLAVRMELVERQENIFTSRGAQRFLALALLDPTMNKSIDPVAVSEAYVIAQTFIRFLEDRYGPDAAVRMIASYRDGRDTDEALVALTGKPMREMDSEFHTWGATHASAFTDSTPWPYMQFYSLGIDPKIQQSIHFSKPHQ